jgi:predicted NBD/HSP70 family sugar kinase
MQTLHEIDPDSPLIHSEDQVKTIQEIVLAAKRGDQVAQKVLMQTTEILGEGLANLVNLLNPDLIVLGSWLARLIGPTILPDLGKVVERHSLAQSFRAANIRLSSLMDDAVSLGAATLVLEDYLANAGKPLAPVRLHERSYNKQPQKLDP